MPGGVPGGASIWAWASGALASNSHSDVQTVFTMRPVAVVAALVGSANPLIKRNNDTPMGHFLVQAARPIPPRQVLTNRLVRRFRAFLLGRIMTKRDSPHPSPKGI